MKTSHLNYKELTAKYDIPRNILNSEMITNFHLDDKILPALQHYRISHYQGDTFKRLSVAGIIKVKDREDYSVITEYIIIYHKCTRVQATTATEIRVSFREAKEEYNLPAYAMVQIVSQ